MSGDTVRFENEPVPSGGSTTYTPAVPGDWSPPPANVGAALDQLAARVKTLEAGAAAAQQIYTCPSGATVLQLVYVSGSGAVDLADATDVSKMKDVQFIASKSDATTCAVVDRGELPGFVGLTPGAQYYADPAVPGGITTTEPDPLTQVVQPVGTAKSATVLDIVIAPPPRIEP